MFFPPSFSTGTALLFLILTIELPLALLKRFHLLIEYGDHVEQKEHLFRHEEGQHVVSASQFLFQIRPFVF